MDRLPLIYPHPIVISLAIVAVFLALAGAELRRLTRLRPDLTLDTFHKISRRYVFVVCGGLAVGGALVVLSNTEYEWKFPIWLQLNRSGMIWGLMIGPLAYLFALAGAVAYRSGHPEARSISLAAVLLFSALGFIQWTTQKPVADRLGEMETDDGVILQSSGVSCAAASTANIVRQLGIDTSEKEMAAILRTNRFGTTDAQMIFALRSLGFESDRFEVDAGSIAELSSPAIVFIDHPETGPESHAVAYMGPALDRFEIWDPLLGRKFFTAAEMTGQWAGHGVTCRKQETELRR